MSSLVCNISLFMIGSLKWKYQTSGMIYTSPAIASDGTIYFGCENFFFFAITYIGIMTVLFVVSNPSLVQSAIYYFI